MNRLTIKQFLPIGKALAWEFFSNPENLAVITPKKLNFSILSVSDERPLHAGQIIRYKISVFPFMRTYWETEITEVVEFRSFTDIQRKGPYAHWAHKHIFREVEGGVEMTDELEYSVPYGPLGSLANHLFVAREVKNIFNYRFQVLKDIFPAKS